MKGFSHLFGTAHGNCTSMRQSVGELTDLLGGEARDVLGRVTAEVKVRLTIVEEMMLGYVETGNAADVLRRYTDTSGERTAFTTSPSIIRAAVARYTAHMADRPYFNRGMDLYHTLHPWDNSLVARVHDSLDPRSDTYWVGPTTTPPGVADG